MSRAFGEIGLHWFGENKQVRVSIPADIVPKGQMYVTFRETRSGIVIGFSPKMGSTLTARSSKTYSAMLPLQLSRKLLGMEWGLNRYRPHWRQEGYVIHVAISKKEEGA